MKTSLLPALLAAAALVGCGPSGDSAPDAASLPAPAGARTFTVGFDADFPPYGFRGDDGSFQGFDLDLAREVCKRKGWMFVAKPIDWAAKDTELNAGTIDCIWNGFTMSPERLDKYTWTEPYVENKQLVLVKTDSGIKSFADLNGKAVAVQDGSSGAEAMEAKLEEAKKADEAFAFKDLKKVPDYVTAFQMLQSGAVDALGLDSAVASTASASSSATRRSATRCRRRSRRWSPTAPAARSSTAGPRRRSPTAATRSTSCCSRSSFRPRAVAAPVAAAALRFAPAALAAPAPLPRWRTSSRSIRSAGPSAPCGCWTA